MNPPAAKPRTLNLSLFTNHFSLNSDGRRPPQIHRPDPQSHHPRPRRKHPRILRSRISTSSFILRPSSFSPSSPSTNPGRHGQPSRWQSDRVGQARFPDRRLGNPPSAPLDLQIMSTLGRASPPQHGQMQPPKMRLHQDQTSLRKRVLSHKQMVTNTKPEI